MDRLDAMSVFAAIVDGGSLSAAGRRLNVPLATVSRKLADLEAHLKTRLITRSTRKLVLTDAGRDYLGACRQILEQVDEAERAASGAYANVKGQLVVAAPIVFGRLHVVPVAAAFLEAAPRGRHPAAPGRPQRQPHRGARRRGAAHRHLAGQQPRRDAGGIDPSGRVCEPGLPGALRHAAIA
jgi:DNA-binding transcriptional LysR family regulator